MLFVILMHVNTFHGAFYVANVVVIGANLRRLCLKNQADKSAFRQKGYVEIRVGVWACLLPL